ncbi:MAG: hypothetical protein WCY27_03215 [archaeon]|jgi:hypothetical protein|nr:hypothetical protein [archaeon]
MKKDITVTKTKKETLTITKAKKKDVLAIYNLQKNQILDFNSKINHKEVTDNGFLVYELSIDDFLKAVSCRNTFLFVAKNKEDVVGYFLAYSLKKYIKLNPSFIEEIDVSGDILKENKVLFGKQLVSNRSFPKIGESLNKEMFKHTKSLGFTLYICEILEKPIRNKRSIEKHLSLNLKKIGTHKDDEDLLWGIYSKKL